MAKRKCPICNLSGDEKEMVQIGKRFYHLGECEAEKRKQEKEADDYKTLVQYLCNLCDVKEPNAVWLSTIKRYREDSNYTSMGIMLTVKHYYEYLHHPIKSESNLLGIVPYYYQEAKEAFIMNLKRRKATRQFFAEGNEMVTHEKIIVKVKPKENEFRKKRMIDMSIFENMGDDE